MNFLFFLLLCYTGNSSQQKGDLYSVHCCSKKGNIADYNFNFKSLPGSACHQSLVTGSHRVLPPPSFDTMSEDM